MRSTRRLLPAILLLAAWSWSVPARAAVRADFNGDGVLDSAALEPAPHPVIDITLSGFGPPLKIVLRERPLSLAAADVDRDGRIDIVGVSRSRGLFYWRNGPGGRFTRAPSHIRGSRLRLPTVLAISKRALHEPSDTSDDESLDSPGNHEPPGAAHAFERAAAPPCPSTLVHAPRSIDPGCCSSHPSPSRAPPA